MNYCSQCGDVTLEGASFCKNCGASLTQDSSRPEPDISQTVAGLEGTLVKDFATFRRMITPILIQILYWSLTVVVIVFGFIALILGDGAVERLFGVLWLLLGPLLIRVWAEFVILFFRVNETLSEIRTELRRNRGL